MFVLGDSELVGTPSTEQNAQRVITVPPFPVLYHGSPRPTSDARHHSRIARDRE